MWNRKINIISVGGILLIPFCSLISHTLIPIPPTVVLWVLSLLIAIAIIIRKHYRISGINSISLPSLIFSIYLFISQLIIGVDFRPLIGPFLAPLYFMVTIYFLDLLNNERSKKLINYFIIISVIIFLTESVWRIYHPSIPDPDAIGSGAYKWFYIFKGPGLMYIETNGLAIHIIVVLFFTFWWGEFIQRKFIIIKILLLLTLCLTFSRAAIISFLAGLIYFKYLRNMKKVNFQLLIFFIIGIFMLSLEPYIIPFLKADASANTKVDLINEVFKYYSNTDWINIFFGIGNYNSKSVFSIYAHNYLLVYAVEMGLVGLVLLLNQFFHFAKKSKNEIFVVLIPFLIQVMSSSTIFIPHFYMTSAIIIYFTRLQKTNNLTSIN